MSAAEFKRTLKPLKAEQRAAQLAHRAALRADDKAAVDSAFDRFVEIGGQIAEVCLTTTIISRRKSPPN